jgi:acetyl-CoA synthetase
MTHEGEHGHGGVPPSDQLAAAANVKADIYDQARANRIRFWERQARRLSWFVEWQRPLDWSDPPYARWFLGGALNVAYNCVDRHVEAGAGDRVALHWEGAPGDVRMLTYADLHRAVCQAANALNALGVVRGDRVAIHLPMVPEAVVTMLACARIGAVHAALPSALDVAGLAAHVRDAGAKIVVTADGGFRDGRAPLSPTGSLKTVQFKSVLDAALDLAPDSKVEHVVVVRRTGERLDWQAGRDIWWHDAVETAPPEHRAPTLYAEHPLFISYQTPGRGGVPGRIEPRGLLHAAGGYLTQVAFSHHAVFDHKAGLDVYWCTADIASISGHSYLVYGPLANGATQVMYEGAAETDEPGRIWQIVQKYGVSVLFAAPGVIRALRRGGVQAARGAGDASRYDLSSLRILGIDGGPVDPDTWLWYRREVGGDRAAVVGTWWQPETGAIMISSLPGVSCTKPGGAARPLPGVVADVLDDSGFEARRGTPGHLVMLEPWPSMARTLWRDDERFAARYWSRFPGLYATGETARIDEDGDVWVLGQEGRPA